MRRRNLYHGLQSGPSEGFHGHVSKVDRRKPDLEPLTKRQTEFRNVDPGLKVRVLREFERKSYKDLIHDDPYPPLVVFKLETAQGV